MHALYSFYYVVDVMNLILFRPEINIKPWNELSKDLQEGNQRIKWIDREPHAFWKGNPAVAATRRDLLKCNVSDKHDWNARVYAQVMASHNVFIQSCMNDLLK